MAAGDLTTLANVKQYMNITVTTDDSLLTRLVTEVSQYMQSWLNRTIASTVYTEKRDGTGGYQMTLREYPIISITSLMIDNIVIPAAADPTQTGYLFDKERIVLNGYQFTRSFQNIVINYTAGYAATPFELEQVCIDMVSTAYKTKDRIGVSSKTINGETVSFNLGAMTQGNLAIMNNYRQVVPN